MKLEFNDIATADTTQYAGDLDRSVCGKRVSLDGLTGLLVASGRAQPTRLRTVFSENRFEPDDLGHLRIEGSEVPRGRDLMRLYEVPAERFDAIAEYERILGAPTDIRAGLRVAVDHTLVAHFDFESEGHGDPNSSPRRVLILSQLEAKRGGAAHTARTSLGCYFHDCRAATLGYQILDKAVLIIPMVSQQYCGLRSCGERSNGAIWMLTPQGFHVVEASLEANRSPSLPGYPGSENDVIVHWVDADGVPPMDLLVRSESGVQGDSTDLSLFVFNSNSQVYEKAKVVPHLNPSEIRELPELLRLTPDGP